MSISGLSFTDSDDLDILSEPEHIAYSEDPVYVIGPMLPDTLAPASESIATILPPADPDGDLLESGIQQENRGHLPVPNGRYRKHERFYFEDGNVTFCIKDVLYCVHRYFFRRDSSHFRAVLGRSVGTPAVPISLDGDAECGELEALLCVLYPAEFDECELKTVEAWTSVLRLSTKWSFPSIRALAVDRLGPVASPVDKVVLGRTYGVGAWIRPGFIALCDRTEPLTKDEGFKLGVGDAVAIMAIREGLRVRRTDVSRKAVEDMVDVALNPKDAEPLAKTNEAAEDMGEEKIGVTAAPEIEKAEKTTKGKEKVIDGVCKPIDSWELKPMHWASSPSTAAALVNPRRAEPIQVQVKVTERPLPSTVDASSITPRSSAERPTSPTASTLADRPPNQPSCAAVPIPPASNGPWKRQPVWGKALSALKTPPNPTKDTVPPASSSTSSGPCPLGFAVKEAVLPSSDNRTPSSQDPGETKEYGKVSPVYGADTSEALARANATFNASKTVDDNPNTPSRSSFEGEGVPLRVNVDDSASEAGDNAKMSAAERKRAKVKARRSAALRAASTDFLYR